MVAPALPHPPSRLRPPAPGGPSLTGRALLALAFLFGFYVLALLAVGLLVGANVVLYAAAGRVQAQLVVVTLFVAFAVLRGVFFVARSDSAELPGLPVDERSQPELVELVRAVARDMGTEPPTRILLVPEVNAAVMQTGGVLGLRRGERVMVIGVPLIEALTVDQLRGVVAHELGHYAGGDTRLGPLTYRAGASIYRTVENLGHDSLLGRLFGAYGRRYLALSQRVRRQQELSADAAAVRLAGRENHVTALRRTAVTSAVFDHFLRFYLLPLWRRGCDADNAFEGYRALLADPARAEDLRAVEAAAHDETTDRYDSHPSLAERVAHADLVSEGPAAGTDPRPARALLADPEDVERQVGALLTREATGRQMERTVDWGSSAGPELAADLTEDGATLLRAAATVAGDPHAASLATVFALVEDGRSDELAAALTGPLTDGTPEQRAQFSRAVLRHHLSGAIGAYLAAERGHTWAVSWSGPIALVDAKGKVRDPYAIADSLLDDPSSGGRLRRSLGGITRLRGFRVESGHTSEPPASSGKLSIVTVVPDVDAHRRHYDLVLTTSSIVLHPIAGGVGYAVRRLMSTQGVTGPQVSAARARLEHLFSLPDDELLGTAPGAVVLAVEQLRQIRKRRGWVVELDVVEAERTWRLRCPSKKDRDLLLGHIQELLVARLPAAA